MTTPRPAKLSPVLLSVLAEAAPSAARVLSTGDEAMAAVLASAAALEALQAASALHRKVGSKTTLTARDAAEAASKAADDREFAALEAHSAAQDKVDNRAA